MDIDDLLAAPELRLLERTPPDVPRRPVSWVATTELDDIARFLRGGEVVLTTLLPTRGDAELVRFVTSVAEVGAAALCVGTGLVRHEIPPAVIEAATRVGLPILESSPEVPFGQISRWVADRIYADQYRIVREHARHQSELLGALHGPDPLGNVVGVLRKVLDAPVVLRDVTGQVIEARPREAGSESSWTSVPVRVRSSVVARLDCGDDRDPAMRELAASLLGLELARRSAVLEGRGELTGQILDDVRHRRGDDPTLSRRLRAAGIDPGSGRLLCVRLSRPQALARITDALFADPRTDVPVVPSDDQLWVFCPDAAHAEVLVARITEQCESASTRAGTGAVDLVDDGDSLDALRSALVQARTLAGLGPGTHTEHPYPLLETVRHSSPAGMLAERTLAPLRRHDAEHGTVLLATLAAYLASGGTVPATCEALVIHRNTLRYRLLSIRRLTGLDPYSLEARVELWLALVAGGVVGDQSERGLGQATATPVSGAGDAR